MSVQKEKSETESDTVMETEQPTVELEPDAMVLNIEEITEMMSEVSNDASVSDFTAPKSNINHGHDTDKHDIRSKYGVRDEFVSEVFAENGIAPNDHAALWLMSYKKEEFIAHDEKVFKDVADTNKGRWDSIDSAKTHAPIAPETQHKLQQ
jgi:hypothetical protein